MGAEPVAEGAERSSALLQQSLAFDERAKIAFQDRSLTELKALYADLKAAVAVIEAHQKSGGDACGCDVALSNLLIITGFAVNKLDGEGRYEPWMLDESLIMLDMYQGFLINCAADAQAAPAAVQLTAQHLKAL